MNIKKFPGYSFAVLMVALLVVVPVVIIYILFYSFRPYETVVDLVFVGILVLVIFILIRTIIIMWQAKGKESTTSP
jgi:chromate transport protein ChrA